MCVLGQGTVVGLNHQVLQNKGLEDLVTVCALCNEARITFQDGKYER
jgi:hypothetical protein